MSWTVPTFADVLDARRRIAPHLRPTPLYRYGALDDLVGTETYVKHENHQPVGAFKVRGGVNLLSRLSPQERRGGVMAASTGNHGQSVAFAARLFDTPATIFVPEGANPGKVAAMRGLGAEVVFHGRDFDDARTHCAQVALETGRRYVHSGDEPHLISGVATGTLEIFEDQPSIEVVIVPVGGGSGAAGACIVAKAIDPRIRVIGVQSAAAPSAYRSWVAGELLDDTSGTVAEGLATRTPFALPQQILRQHLDDFVLVSDDEILSAQAMLIETTHNLVEAAGAAALAAALNLQSELRGRKVAIVASGGNATPEQLLEVVRRRVAPSVPSRS